MSMSLAGGSRSYVISHPYDFGVLRGGVFRGAVFRAWSFAGPVLFRAALFRTRVFTGVGFYGPVCVRARVFSGRSLSGRFLWNRLLLDPGLFGPVCSGVFGPAFSKNKHKNICWLN